MNLKGLKPARYKRRYLPFNIRLSKTLMFWVRDNTTQRENVQKIASNVASDLSKRVDRECKAREWKDHHRIPVVDQGGRVIGYRYLNGGENK